MGKQRKNLFDHLKVITNKQNKDYYESLSKEDRKSWSDYMINRFISMEMMYTEIANIAQLYELSGDKLYRFYIDILPKQFVYFDYIKGKKKYNKNLLKCVSKYYEVSKKEASGYIDIFMDTEQGKKQLKEICRKFGNKWETIEKWMETQ